MSLKAVIFDFDGVIADTEMLHYRAFCAVLEGEGVLLGKEEYWDKYLGFSDKEAFEHIAKDKSFELSDVKLGWLIDEKAAVFDEFVRVDNCLLPGVTNLLVSLKENGIAMAICSGALLSDIEGVFNCASRHFNYDYFSFFTTVVTADDVKQGKPHPEGYNRAIELLNSKVHGGVLPVECVVVEDSHWGLEAAIAAGTKTIAVAGSYSMKELEGKADLLVTSLEELDAPAITAMLQ